MIRRVAVTGMGMVTPLGVGREIFTDRLFSGEGAVRPIEGFDAGRFGSRLAAEVATFSAKDFISARNLRRMDRNTDSHKRRTVLFAVPIMGLGTDAASS